MKCTTALDTTGAPVWDAHDQGKWRDEYTLCPGEVPSDADAATCPKCGEVYESLKAEENES